MLGKSNEGCTGSNDGTGYEDVWIGLGHCIESLTSNGGHLGVLGQQSLGHGVGLRLESSHTLHQCTLLLERCLDLCQAVGDGHSSLQLGDDLNVIAKIHAQELGGSLERLEAAGGKTCCTGYLIKDTSVRCCMFDRCLDIIHRVTCLASTRGERLDAGGHCLTEG